MHKLQETQRLKSSSIEVDSGFSWSWFSFCCECQWHEKDDQLILLFYVLVRSEVQKKSGYTESLWSLFTVSELNYSWEDIRIWPVLLFSVVFKLFLSWFIFWLDHLLKFHIFLCRILCTVEQGHKHAMWLKPVTASENTSTNVIKITLPSSFKSKIIGRLCSNPILCSGSQLFDAILSTNRLNEKSHILNSLIIIANIPG